MGWEEQDYCLATANNSYLTCEFYNQYVSIYQGLATQAYLDEDYPEAIYNILNCLSFVWECFEGLITSDDDYDPKFPIIYYLKYHTGVAELTYQSICEAWGANDFEGRAVTIAFIDRMRQLLWDEPFSAIWAAKPEVE